ncbi:putative cytochrome c [Sphaerotilus natans subsp. natans DSM 6575]|uniref:Putative cytochrome c n=1 Tax=Sphaerotilus natans subsp. natans DSM 6575 TaxID=1286631 RepID=A0A059KSM2_9BURK|nr:hypothetical protein [Sphaerotilus natans]KDB54093.1 putative cytochrome c [Sphaerotilus natans subsp. natans DSM 6575]SIQ67469.1 hypothetical protein SAMN05421778_10484 [Sphaerotilus natans]
MPLPPRLLAPALLGLMLMPPAGGAETGPRAEALHLRALAAGCAQCHGTDGRAVEGASLAALAGRDAGELRARLRAFRTGSAPATVMHQITRGYSPEQLDALAKHFARQSP